MMMKGIAALLCLLLVGCTTPEKGTVGVPRQHTVQSGETLVLIAQKYYGADRRSEGIKAIWKANPQIGKGPFIQTKMVLTIPELE